MNKRDYLRKLARLISRLPSVEHARVMDFYSEILDDKIEGGATEEQAVASLGDVRALAQKILYENPARKSSSGGKVALVVGLSLLGVLVVCLVTVLALSYTGVKTYGGAASAQVEPAESESGAAFGSTPSEGAAPGVAGEIKDGEDTILTVPVDGLKSVSLDVNYDIIKVDVIDGVAITVTYREDKNQPFKSSQKEGRLNLERHDRRSGWQQMKDAISDDGPDRTITLGVPRAFAGSLDLETDMGIIEVVGVSTEGDIQARSDMGKVLAQDVSCRKLELSSDMGMAKAVNAIAAAKAELDTDMGVVDIERLQSPDISLESNMGPVSGSIVGKEADYAIEVSVGLGKSNLSSKRGGGKLLHVNTDMGAIELAFVD